MGDAQIGVQEQVIRVFRWGSRKLDKVGLEHAAALALQRAWRRKKAFVLLKKLNQGRLCRQRREEMQRGIHLECETCASVGEKSADLESRNLKKAWKVPDAMLFSGTGRMQMSDRGDNWNERWQEALSLPTGSVMKKRYRNSILDAVYSDFVHTAVTYGRTIISEYFLHGVMKSVRVKRLGGVAGGKKYLWRGILFKLADGSQGPYGGSDEAAAKAAGHELRGASEYLKTGVGLCVPLMCLLDYKGFRMVAQAHLPLGCSSHKMGSHDAGRTVRNSCPVIDGRTAEAARALGLRAHVVGGWKVWIPHTDGKTGKKTWTRKHVKKKVLHAAADVEGHKGTDSRMYLLDLARAFPPEDPNATPHLSGMLSVSANVLVRRGGKKKKARHATVIRAHASLEHYDILYKNGTLEESVQVDLLRDKRLFMYSRLLRPEFLRDRGRTVLDKVKVPQDHKFPAVKVGNPMLFAIACAKFSKGRSQRASARTANTEGTKGNAGEESRSGDVQEGQGGDKAELGDESVPEGTQGADADRADGALELNEKECGIGFVSKGEKYLEGFVEDPEELIRRGGAGYPPPSYDSIVGDGYEPANFDGSDGDDGGSDGGSSDDGDSNGGLNGRGTSPAVRGSVLRSENDAGAAARSASGGVPEEAKNVHTGLDKASESNILTSAEVAPMGINNKGSNQEPSSGDIDPAVCTPASPFTGVTAGSGCGGEHGLHEDPTTEYCSEGGYHNFSEASLDPQVSRGMAGLSVNNGRGVSADSAGAEPETLPLSGEGYSSFSSASFVSSGSSSSMPKPPDTPLATKGLGGGGSGGQGAPAVSLVGGGGGGSGDGGRGAYGQERGVPQSAAVELESRLDVVKVAIEDGEARRNGSPTPLSPDALTPFSRGDPEAKERDREVTVATHFLLTVVVPATAKLLCAMSPSRLSKTNLVRELHEHGVNVRHIGLLRAYVTDEAVASGTFEGKSSAEIVRDGALVEVVVRTLKLVLRSFQRSWMKSEQSSSERGMHLLVAQFLNLVTGHHQRAGAFWLEDVTSGVCQRFGTVALTQSEREGLWEVFSNRPNLLLTIVKELVKVTGVRFVESVQQELRSETAESVIMGYNFTQKDIREIEAVVTRMDFLGDAEV